MNDEPDKTKVPEEHPDRPHHHGPGGPHHHAPHGGIHEHREELLDGHAHEEINKVREQLAEAVEKKELHVHRTHSWLHKLNHASSRLLRMHEDELDNALPESAWANEALEAIFDADKQIVGIAKAISATGHTVKGDEFDKAGISEKAAGLNAALDKALAVIPDKE